MTTVSAPGKVMIAGEYAVLEGHSAVVAAVSARARASISRTRLSPSGSSESGWRESGTLPPEAVLARRHAEALVNAASPELNLDVHALQFEGRKLGLGSSAAGSVACAAVVLCESGVEIETQKGRALVQECALAGHRAVAPEGSGADVAASVWGGFLRFSRAPTGEVDVTPMASSLPGAEVLVWTGEPARTSDLVRAVRVFSGQEPRAYERAIGAVREAADQMQDAIARSDIAALIDATGAHHRAMDLLGTSAGAPIVDARLSHLAELASRFGGASKPSGAGGGDVAIAFFPNSSYASAFADACASGGMRPLPFGLGDGGVRKEPEEEALACGRLDEGKHP